MMAASAAFSAGRMMLLNPSFLAAMAIEGAPLMGRSLPLRDSPQAIRKLSVGGSCPDSQRIPRAIGRSYTDLTFAG